MNLREVIDSIWESTQQGIYFPAEWKGKLSMEEGYQVQLGLLDRYLEQGQQHAGWKVGLTAKAIQEQLAYDERVFGFLLASSNRPSKTLFTFDELVAPCFETEICVVLDRPLEGPDLSPKQAREAISKAAPAFELIERRGNFSADLPLSMTDNVQARYYVTGEFREISPDKDLKKASMEIILNGEVVGQADASEVLGGPAASVAWLANVLSTYGRKLEEGTQIMTGSLTRQYPVGQGDYIEADFNDLGSVAMEFE